ncbi:unnamed protein product [Brassica oleracea]
MVKSAPSETAMDENRGSICRKSAPSREKRPLPWPLEKDRENPRKFQSIPFNPGHNGQNQRPNPHRESQKNLAVSPSRP